MRKGKSFVVDIGGRRYLFKEGKVLENIEVHDVEDFLFYIFVPDESFKVEISKVSAPSKYASFVLTKRLEESGVLGSGQKLWIYLKRGISKNECNMVYSLFSYSQFSYLNNCYLTHPSGMVVWDVMGFLMEVISSVFKKRSGMVILHVLDEFFVGIGSGKEILFLSRYLAPSTTREDLEKTLSIIYGDLLGQEQEKGIKVDRVLWIEGFGRYGEDEIDFGPFKEKELQKVSALEFEDEDRNRWYSSFPGVLENISFGFAIFGREEKWIVSLENKTLFFNGVLILLILLGLICGFVLNSLNNNIIKNSNLLDEQIKSYEKKLENFSFPKIETNISEMVSLFKNLDMAISSPSYADIWQHLSLARPKHLYLESFDVNYKSKSVDISLRGKVFLPPISAQKEFSDFLRSLKKSGFELNNFKLDVGTEYSLFQVSLNFKYNR